MGSSRYVRVVPATVPAAPRHGSGASGSNCALEPCHDLTCATRTATFRSRGEGGGEVSTADQKRRTPTTPTAWPGTRVAPVPQPKPAGHFLVRFWRSAVGKKWVMAITGIVLLGYVLAHMIGNLKVFLGRGAHQRATPSGCATSVSRCSPAPSCCGRMRIGLIARVRRSTSSPRTSSRGSTTRPGR